jgi:hypothetical protein
MCILLPLCPKNDIKNISLYTSDDLQVRANFGLQSESESESDEMAGSEKLCHIGISD